MGEGGEGIPQQDVVKSGKSPDNSLYKIPNLKQVLRNCIPQVAETAATVGIGTLVYHLSIRAGIDQEVTRDTVRGMFTVLTNVRQGIEHLRPHAILLPTERQEIMFNRLARVVLKSTRIVASGHLVEPDHNIALQLGKIARAPLELLSDPLTVIKNPGEEYREMFESIGKSLDKSK